MAATVTFGTIKNRIRFEADFENATAAVVDPTRLNEVANAAMRRVWSLLLRHRPDHCLVEAALATVANNPTVNLPAGFQQLRLLEILDGASYVPMSPYSLSEQWRLTQAGAPSGPTDIRYRIQGATLKLAPTPSAIYTLRLYYLPTFTPLVLDADTFDGINGFEDLVVAEGVLDLLRREKMPTGEWIEKRDDLRGQIIPEATDTDDAPTYLDGGAAAARERRQGLDLDDLPEWMR